MSRGSDRLRKGAARAARGVDAPKLAAAAAATVAAGAGIAAGRAGLDRIRRTPTTLAYRLRSDEPVGEGLVRLARGRLEHALGELRGEGEDDSAAAVHEARKDIKKLRALLRLARDPLGDATYGSENAELRDIGRALGGLRDADVVLETLDELAAECPDLLTSVAAGRVRRVLEERREDAASGDARAATIDAAAERLDAVRDRVEGWELDGDGWELIGEGMRRTYRRGRRRMRDARRDPGDEALHEWRKRAKDHWYQLRIVRCAWPPVLEPLAEETHRLTEQLGDHHDIGVLVRQARDGSGPASGRDLDQLAAAAERRRAQLERAAFAGGARLYAEGSGAFERRMARYWQARG